RKIEIKSTDSCYPYVFFFQIFFCKSIGILSDPFLFLIQLHIPVVWKHLNRKNRSGFQIVSGPSYEKRNHQKETHGKGQCHGDQGHGLGRSVQFGKNLSKEKKVLFFIAKGRPAGFHLFQKSSCKIKEKPQGKG